MLLLALPPSGRWGMMTQGGSLGLDEMGNEPMEADGWDQGEMQKSLRKGSGENSPQQGYLWGQKV